MSGAPAQDKNVTFGEARAGLDQVPRLLRSGAAAGGVVWSMGAASCVVLAKTVEDGIAARRLLERAEVIEKRAEALLAEAGRVNAETWAVGRRSVLAICTVASVMWLFGVLA